MTPCKKPPGQFWLLWLQTGWCKYERLSTHDTLDEAMDALATKEGSWHFVVVAGVVWRVHKGKHFIQQQWVYE